MLQGYDDGARGRDPVVVQPLAGAAFIRLHSAFIRSWQQDAVAATTSNPATLSQERPN